MSMNQIIKAQWMARLRSGEIEQAQEYLGQGDARCCLGVLCDLAGEAGIIEPRQGTYDDDGDWYADLWNYGQGEEVLPEPVWRWAGITPGDDGGPRDGASNPRVTVPEEIMPRLTSGARLRVLSDSSCDGPSGTLTLAQLNDALVTFPVIADIIDANDI